ncbi:hypothetical protein V8J38_11180 [Brevundimonas olei]|uniref:Uncharacterized protein n=1 Tax=Brevundimonas olei TaxID=657642 RepID=A0ABZ2IA57_9CAUL
MRSPKAPQEDPAVVAAREREERRAENARTEETQALLLGATQRRLRRFGRIGSGGSVPIYGGGSSGGSIIGGGQGGGRIPGGGVSIGGGGGFGGGGFDPIRDQVVLY